MPENAIVVVHDEQPLMGFLAIVRPRRMQRGVVVDDVEARLLRAIDEGRAVPRWLLVNSLVTAILNDDAYSDLPAFAQLGEALHQKAGNRDSLLIRGHAFVL